MKNCLILIVCFSFGFTLVAQGKFERKKIKTSNKSCKFAVDIPIPKLDYTMAF